MASRRVVLTFNTWDVAARPHGISAATVKQYGRRLVLDIGKTYNATEDDDWIRAQLNYTVKIEEDILVRVEGKDYTDIWMDDVDSQYSFDALHGVVLEDPPTPEGLEPMDWPDYTSTPVWDMVTTAVVEDAGSSVTSSQVLGPVPWNLADGEPYGLQVEGLWRKTNSTPDVVVAVVDSGIAQGAKSAFLNLLDGYDFVSDLETAADGDGRDPDATDFGPVDASCPTPGWHGTKVASVLAAKHTSGVYGVAQNCSVLPVRVLGLCSEGYANDITDAIVWAVGGNINGVPRNPRPAKVIGLSLAGSGACPSYLQSAINQARAAGAIVVAAAGNEGLPSIANTFPANCDYVISVGARARDGSVAAFSNKGAAQLAPGVAIPVLHPLIGVTLGSGTSFAVPHVMGAELLSVKLSAKSCGSTCPAGTLWTYNYYTNDKGTQVQECRECLFLKDGIYCPVANMCFLGEYWCPIGTYSSYELNPYATECTICDTGQYTPLAAGNSACTECDVGSYSIDHKSCVSCPAGYTTALYKRNGCFQCLPGQATFGNDFCWGCSPGTYSSGLSASSCTYCGMGTYMTHIGATACQSCTAACPANQWLDRPCAGFSDIICCPSASVGSYSLDCKNESPCPALSNGVYMLTATASYNRCMDTQCNAGYFASPANLAALGSLCNVSLTLSKFFTSTFALVSTCESAVASLCQPYATCGAGTTLYRNLAGQQIMDSVTGDTQCTPCATTCTNGSIRISDCTTTAQAVCAKCPASGTVKYGFLNACQLLSDLPNGYFPAQLTFTSSYMSQFTTNQYVWPTKQLANDNTVSDLSWSSGFTMNTFLPCNAPPVGYVFKAWSPAPAVQSFTYTGQTSISMDCNIQASMECIGYTSASDQGWFRNSTSLCQSCTRTSTYSQCTWGQFSDLNTCTKLQDTTCQPCRGMLPANAVWTMSKSPFYFNSLAASPCDWDCNAGFYKDAATQTCRACTNIPANANADYGPFRISDSIVPATICLQPGVCKYFGGTQAGGCMFVCQYGYKFSMVFDPISYSCDPCPSVTCPPGQTTYRLSDGCMGCQTCSPMVANAQYVSGCTFNCNAGYYKSSDSSCSPCTVATCPANYYSGGCGGLSDNSCQLCSSCATGTQVGTACTATANTVCVPCTATLIPNSGYSSTCAVVCNGGYVMVGGQCRLCATTNADCPVGKRYNATCTPDNVGCSNCTAPSTLNWCWTAGSTCAWDCLQYYRKSGTVCNYDTTKTWTVSCLSVPVTTAAQTTTTVAAPTSTTTAAATTSTTRATTSTTAAQTTTTVAAPTSTTTAAATTSTTRATTTTLATTSTTQATTSTTRATTTTQATTSTTRATTTTQATTSTTEATTSTTEEPLVTTEIPETTPEPETPVVVRETLTVSNVTVQQCACSANDLNGRLSSALGTPTYIISCVQGDAVVLCTNFTCPCNATARRRLLQQQDPTTQINYVSKALPSAPPPTTQAIQAAIQPVLAQAVVVSVAERETLPTNEITWDTTVLLFKRAAEDAGFATTGVVVAVVIVFIAIVGVTIGVAIRCCAAPHAPPQPILALKLMP